MSALAGAVPTTPTPGSVRSATSSQKDNTSPVISFSAKGCSSFLKPSLAMSTCTSSAVRDFRGRSADAEVGTDAGAGAGAGDAGM
eukprot:CAMPEP_0173178130 /NCGR_PEP_ID=MMETSP1141-20130122/5360_1 /TAXON_ID=483371 /ORGANISM="non described non described, Strain CCMP2298" /LENGTH=84 /DNA_ID=CAMNT_0014100577 /DNA_START=426 /DNA_END=680 /DNA_ORIENTATION=-